MNVGRWAVAGSDSGIILLQGRGEGGRWLDTVLAYSNSISS
jgi:hypothetical protein